MKIVHLSTFDTGGAATAALRLHEGLLGAGVSSSFLSLYSSPGGKDPSRFRYPKYAPSLPKRIIHRVGIPVSQQDRNKQMIQDLKGSFEAFTFPLTDHRVEFHPLVRQADIVHLHWVADFINYPTFFQNVSKPVVWTFHDMNPIMGGFHYLGDLERNRRWQEVEEKLRKVKASAMGSAPNLTIATPSQWLAEHVERNPTFAKFPLVHIPYGLDLDVFRPYGRKIAQEVFNLSETRKVLLFVSERIDNFRKGFDILRDALSGLDGREAPQIVSIGARSRESTWDNSVLSLGTITDSRLLALAFSAADAFILPSREDNLPNVMLEALACGTPVISFSNGGMRDVIKTGFNGILVPEVSAEALRAGIRSFLTDEYAFDRAAIRTFALNNFSLSLQAKQYLKLYDQLVG